MVVRKPLENKDWAAPGEFLPETALSEFKFLGDFVAAMAALADLTQLGHDEQPGKTCQVVASLASRTKLASAASAPIKSEKATKLLCALQDTCRTRAGALMGTADARFCDCLFRGPSTPDDAFFKVDAEMKGVAKEISGIAAPALDIEKRYHELLDLCNACGPGDCELVTSAQFFR